MASIFDINNKITHDLLIENGWDQRVSFGKNGEECYYLLKLKVLISFSSLIYRSQEIWFTYDPSNNLVRYIDDINMDPCSVDSMNDINIYIQFILNHYNFKKENEFVG